MSKNNEQNAKLIMVAAQNAFFIGLFVPICHAIYRCWGSIITSTESEPYGAKI
jgi:hypothetical protein